MASNGDAIVSGHHAILSKLKFVSHAPPDITKRPHIVGICAVPMDLAGLDCLGHHVSNFLAWKMTFHREGNKDDQAWFSLVDIANAMSEHKTRYPTVVDGKPKDLSDAIGLIRVDSNIPNLFTAFVDELDKQAKAAQQKDECLVVIISGEVSPELDICLELEENRKYLTKDSWLGMVLKRYGIPITIIVPASFSAGWEIRPFAGRHKHAEGIDHAVLDKMLAKQCGGAFASTVLQSWTEEREARDMVRTTEGPAGELYKQLYTGIHDCMIRNMLPSARQNVFRFDADQDEWEAALGSRKGPLSLAYFAKKWAGIKNLSEPTASVQGGGYKFLAGAFGGTRESQLVHLSFLVRQELRGCPGEWDQATSKRCLAMLTTFLQTVNPTEEHAREVFTLIEWRCSMNSLADIVVDFFVLPRPQSKACRYWDWKAQQEMDKKDRALGNFRMALFGLMSTRWPKNPLPVGRQRDVLQDHWYWRPLQFITSAVAMKFYRPRPSGPSQQEIDESREFMVTCIGGFVDRLIQMQCWMITENKELIDVFDKWLATAKPDPSLAAPKPEVVMVRPPVPIVKPEPPTIEGVEAHEIKLETHVPSVLGSPPAQQHPVKQSVAQNTPVQQSPAQQLPDRQVSVQEAPVQIVPAQQPPVQQAPGPRGLSATAPLFVLKDPAAANVNTSPQASHQMIVQPRAASPAVRPPEQASMETSPILASPVQQNVPAVDATPANPPAQQSVSTVDAKPTATEAPIEGNKPAAALSNNSQPEGGKTALEAISETLAGLDPQSLQSLIALLAKQVQQKEQSSAGAGISGYKPAPGPPQSENIAPRGTAQPPGSIDTRRHNDDHPVLRLRPAANDQKDSGGKQEYPVSKPTPSAIPAPISVAAPGVAVVPQSLAQPATEQRTESPAQKQEQPVHTSKGVYCGYDEHELEAIIRAREAKKAEMAANCHW